MPRRIVTVSRMHHPTPLAWGPRRDPRSCSSQQTFNRRRCLKFCHTWGTIVSRCMKRCPCNTGAARSCCQSRGCPQSSPRQRFELGRIDHFFSAARSQRFTPRDPRQSKCNSMSFSVPWRVGSLPDLSLGRCAFPSTNEPKPISHSP